MYPIWNNYTHTHTHIYIYIYIKVKVKCSRYRPGVAQRVGTGIALLFHDHDQGGVWSAAHPSCTLPLGKKRYPGLVWMGGKSHLHRDLIPDCPARSQSLYRLSYPAHILYIYIYTHTHIHIHTYIHTCAHAWQQTLSVFVINYVAFYCSYTVN